MSLCFTAESLRNLPLFFTFFYNLFAICQLFAIYIILSKLDQLVSYFRNHLTKSYPQGTVHLTLTISRIAAGNTNNIY